MFSFFRRLSMKERVIFVDVVDVVEQVNTGGMPTKSVLVDVTNQTGGPYGKSIEVKAATPIVKAATPIVKAATPIVKKYSIENHTTGNITSDEVQVKWCLISENIVPDYHTYQIITLTTINNTVKKHEFLLHWNEKENYYFLTVRKSWCEDDPTWYLAKKYQLTHDNSPHKVKLMEIFQTKPFYKGLPSRDELSTELNNYLINDVSNIILDYC